MRRNRQYAKRAPQLRQPSSQQYYRSLFDSIDQGVCTVEVVFDTQGRPVDYVFLDVNRAFEEQTGLSNAVGRSMRSLAPTHEEHWFEIYSRIALTGEPQRFDLPAEALGRWYSVYAFRVGAPETRRVAILFEDISARKRAEQALRESEERFRTIFEQANDFILTADLTQRITSCNPALTAALGYQPHEVIGRSISEFIKPTEFERTSAMLAQKLQQGGSTRYEVEVTARDGHRMIWDVNSCLTFGPLGEPTGLHAIAHDVTEKHKAEEARREADRRKDEFLATLAHELRNPLAPIRQSVAIARSPNASPAQLRWSLDVIERQGRHMALLLDDLMDAVRISAGKLELRRESVELAAIIDMAVETARPFIDARRHDLVVHLTSEPIYLKADALRLAQVIANLLTNAAKYSEPEARIDLSAVRDAEHVEIRVRDVGIGIDPAMLPRVFEMFSQARGALDRSEGGLGIGLALVKGLVELHGGQVEALSQGLGHGSEFIVRLPHFSIARPVRPHAAQSERARVAVPVRIVIADDNCDALESLKLLLDLDGHEVHAAHDGQAAYELAASVRPQVMLLDIGMPRLNGYELARKIREEPWGTGVRLVALTGWGQVKDQQSAAEAGFDDHLTKPVDHEAIRSVLRLR